MTPVNSRGDYSLTHFRRNFKKCSINANDKVCVPLIPPPEWEQFVRR